MHALKGRINMSKYGYNFTGGGFLEYEGVSADGKHLGNITVDRDNSTVTVNYADGSVCTVTADISQNGNVSTITRAFGSWTNSGSVSDVPAKYSLLAMLLNGGSGDPVHPDRLTYTDDDPDYELPEDITPASGETFDTITETWYAKTAGGEDINVVWGVGILNKGTSDETAVRLIYPDFSQLELVGFDF